MKNSKSDPSYRTELSKRKLYGPPPCKKFPYGSCSWIISNVEYYMSGNWRVKSLRNDKEKI